MRALTCRRRSERVPRGAGRSSRALPAGKPQTERHRHSTQHSTLSQVATRRSKLATRRPHNTRLPCPPATSVPRKHAHHCTPLHTTGRPAHCSPRSSQHTRTRTVRLSVSVAASRLSPPAPLANPQPNPLPLPLLVPLPPKQPAPPTLNRPLSLPSLSTISQHIRLSARILHFRPAPNCPNLLQLARSVWLATGVQLGDMWAPPVGPELDCLGPTRRSG